MTEMIYFFERGQMNGIFGSTMVKSRVIFQPPYAY